ncbi:MAG: tetratricopeptide repeat protein [Deltaproteobacteria bacterium]|nr:tetratricopeptide repeat protein [Deltaproteobacteria bacterium]
MALDGSGRGLEGNPLGLALGFVEGTALVTLSDRVLADGVRLLALELALAEVEFPLDLQGGAEEFQRRSTRLGYLALEVETRAVAAALDAALAAQDRALRDVRLTADGGRWVLEGTLGPKGPPVAADVWVGPAAGEGLEVHVHDVRVFGPSALCGVGVPRDVEVGLREVLARLGRRDADAVLTQGASVFSFDPVGALLWALLPVHGWKVPIHEGVAIRKVAFTPQGNLQILVGESTAGHVPPPAEAISEASVMAARARADAERLLPAVEAQVSAGALPAAFSVLRDALEEGSERALELLLSVGAADRSLFGATVDLAADQLTVEPDHVAARLAMAVVAEAEARPDDAREHYEQAGRALRRAGRRRRAGLAYRAAARVAAEGSAEQARLLEETIALRPDDPWALEGLVRVLPGLGRATAAVRAARRLASLAPDPETRLVAHLAAGRLLFEQVEDPVGARRELERALKLAPEHPEALEGLARAARLQGEPRRAATILERLATQAERAGDNLRASRLSLELGDLWQGLDPDAAQARYRKALALAPHTARPRLALVEAALAAGRPGDALEVVDEAVPHLDRISAPEERPAVATLRRLAARLYTEAGDREADAVAQLEALLELDPTHSDSLEALTELYTARGDRAQAVELLSRRAKRAVEAGEPGQAAALYARCHEALAHDPDAQADLRFAVREATERFRTHRALLDLRVALDKEAGDPDAWAAALDRRLLLDDPPEVRAGLWAELGRALEAAERPADAIRAYEEALGGAGAGDKQSALRLVHLYRARADEARLESALERAARLEEGPLARAALFAERARILFNRGEEGEAWASMQEALHETPDDLVLLPFATSLALKAGDAARARNLVEDRLRLLAREPAEARLSAYVDLASVEEISGDRAAVVEALEAAYEAADPQSDRGRRLADRLARELEALEDHARLAKLMRARGQQEQAPAAERAGWRLEAARLFARMEADEDAEAEVRAVLALADAGGVEPHHAEAALDVLDTVAARDPDPTRQARALALRAVRTGGAEGEALRVEASARFEAAGRLDDAIEILEGADTLLAVSPPMLERLGALCTRAGQADRAAWAFGQAARLVTEADGAPAAVALHGQAAEACATTGDLDTARVHDRVVLGAAESGARWLPPALTRLEAHARTVADHELLSEVLGRQAEGAGPDDAARLLLEKADLHLATPGQDRAGLVALRRAHDLAPPDSEIADYVDARLTGALERMGLYAEQAAVLSAWAERAPTSVDRARLLHRAAEVYAGRLRDRSMALSRAQAAVRADPTLPEARALRIDLLRAEGRTDALAEALAEEAAQSADGEQAAARWLEAAELVAPPHHVADAPLEALERALGLVRRAATAAPSDLRPVEAEIRYIRALERSDEELSALGRLVERLPEGPAKVAVNLRRAHLLRGALGDDVAAYMELVSAQDGLQELDEAGLERVLEALPRPSHEAYGIEHGDDLVPAVLRAGLDLTERLEDWPSHARYLLALVDETESAAERAQLRVRAGEVLEWRLGDGEGAEREYLTALATDPEHLEARRALSQFYVAVDRFGDLAESLGVEALVEVFESFTDKEPAKRIIAAAEALWPVLPEGSSERADVQLRLARTYEGQGADDEGVHILEKVVQTAPRPHRAEAMERLMRLFERQERFDLYCDVLRRKAEHFETDRERAQTLAELGEALEWRLGDGQAAEAEYRAALAADPHCVAARRGLSELLSSQDRFTEVGRDVGRDALRAVMDGLLEQGSRDRERAFAAASALAEQSDEGARGRLWLHVADALEVGPDDETARQREALEAAAESPSSRGAALSRLGNLLRRVGDRAALVEVLARRAEHAESNQEQIDLHFERIRILDEAAAAGELGSTEAEERVEAALGRILAVAPDHPDARARKAALLAEQERWPELVALAGVQALLPHQTAARAAGDRAMVAAIIEERARAERGPAKAELLVELVGFTDLERGAAGDVPRDAEGLYQAALEAAPDFAPAQEGLRAHLESEGRFKEIGTRVSPEALRETVRGLKRLDQAAQLLPATLALAAVLEADPAAAPERVRLFAEAAALHLSEQDEEAAEHALRQALALDPEQPEARHELTELLVRQDRLHDLADVDLSLVAQVATDASTAGDVDREIAALRVLAARREGNARADTLVLVAALEKDRGGAAAAEADLLAALAEDPEHGLARAELESILWAADRLPDALERLGPEAFLRRASMLADGEPAHMIAALDAVQENLQGASAAEAYQMRAGVRLPGDDDWSRRAEALERAKAAWDALGDAQGSLQSRMAMVDLVRERDDEGALLAALGDALAHAEAPEDRAALAMEQAALLALLERPAEARALVEPLVGDAAVPLAHRRAAARLLADDLISRDLDALDLADLELRGQALEVLTTGGPEPEALDGARWLEELSAVREVMGAESAHIAEPLEAALARLESAETGLRIRKRLQGLYEEMGDWRRAEAHAAHVAEAEGAPEAWVGLSELRAWLDDRDGAESALRRALDLDPSHGPAHASLLRLAEQSGDLGSVIQQLQTWADVDDGGDPEARLLRVLRALEMAAEAGEAGQAEALAERAIGLAPAGRAAEVAQTACRHLAALELTEAQVNLLTRALSLEPRAPAELRLTLAELLVGLDRADEARTAVEAGIHRDTPEEHPLVAWVVADADTQPDDRAARRLMALAERLRTGPAARRLFALAAARAEASGDLDAARAAWGTVLREVGAGDRAVAARDALVRLARSEDDPRRLLSALLESVEDAPDPRPRPGASKRRRRWRRSAWTCPPRPRRSTGARARSPRATRAWRTASWRSCRRGGAGPRWTRSCGRAPPARSRWSGRGCSSRGPRWRSAAWRTGSRRPDSTWRPTARIPPPPRVGRRSRPWRGPGSTTRPWPWRRRSRPRWGPTTPSAAPCSGPGPTSWRPSAGWTRRRTCCGRRSSTTPAPRSCKSACGTSWPGTGASRRSRASCSGWRRTWRRARASGPCSRRPGSGWSAWTTRRGPAGP